jgi:hypothetical protein
MYMLQSIFGVGRSSGLTEPASRSVGLPGTTGQCMGLPGGVSRSLGLPRMCFCYSHTLPGVNVGVVAAGLYRVFYIRGSSVW